MKKSNIKLTEKMNNLLSIAENIAIETKSTSVNDLHLLLAILKSLVDNKEENKKLIAFLNNNLPKPESTIRYNIVNKSALETIMGFPIENAQVLLSKEGFDSGFFDLFIYVYTLIEKTCVANDEDDLSELEYDKSMMLHLMPIIYKPEQDEHFPEYSDILVELFSNKVYKSKTVFLRLGALMGNAVEFLENLKSFGAASKANLTYENRPNLDLNINLKGLITNINEVAAKNKEFVDTQLIDKYIESIELEFLKESDADKSCILVGPSGCGKTTIVKELAKRINEGNVFDSIKGYAIYEIKLDSLVAGTKYRGQFEEKCTKLFDIVSKEDKVILFIDELEQALNTGGTEGAINFGDMIKSKLSNGSIIAIGCATTEDYNKILNTDNAFVRRFNKILIDEVSREKTKDLLLKKSTNTEFYQNKVLTDKMADEIITTADKYITDLNNPSKSLVLFKAAYAQSIRHNTDSKYITKEDISAALKLKFNTETYEDRAKETFDELNEQILDQSNAIYKIAEVLGMIEHNIVDPQKPLATLMFYGPTGTGKTESAKIIARKYFGNEDRLVKVDMNNYTTEVDVNKLFGSAPGYVGYESETYLVKHLREKPNSVVLFDEIEKAHDTVKQALLQMTDEGYFVDNKGNKISLKNTIIIFTTNAGYDAEFGKAHGAGFIKEAGSVNDIEKAIRKQFSPEFLGRINELIGFKSLSPKVINKLIERNKKLIEDRSELTVNFTKKDITNITNEAKVEICGARNLKEVVKKYFYRRWLEDTKPSHSKKSSTILSIKKEREEITNGSRN